MSDFKSEYQQVNQVFKAETGTSIAQVVTQAAVTFYLFGKATNRARKREWPAALFYAVLWSGVSRNGSDSMAYRQRRVLAGKSSLDSLFN